MTYAITGASGQLGRRTAERLLEQVDPAQVVLLTRTPAQLDDLARRGATVRAADFDDASALPAALDGVEQLLLVSADRVGERLAGHRAAVDAAVATGVHRVIYTSIPRPVPDNPAGVVADHRATEEYLLASGLAVTLLRNNLYADMQVATLQQAAASGQLVTNAGDGRVAYVTRADCAAAAAGALLREDATGPFDVTGPQAVSTADLAELAGRIAGRAVTVVDVDDAAYIAGLQEAGLPEPVATLIASFGTSARLGYLDEVTTVVRDFGGVEPTPLAALLA